MSVAVGEMQHTGSESSSQKPCHSRFSCSVAGLKGAIGKEFDVAEVPFVVDEASAFKRRFFDGGVIQLSFVVVFDVECEYRRVNIKCSTMLQE